MVTNFKIRTTIIFFVFAGIYLVIAFNLYLIQIRHYDFYKRLAEQQYQVTITQVPPRGLILDRTGKNYLAMNKDYVSAFVLPRQIENDDRLVDFLQSHFPDAAARYAKKKGKHFIFIKRRLSKQEQELISMQNLPEIKLLSEPGRYYPLASAIPLVGLTDIDNKGLLGFELVYDHLLAGKPTTYQLEKDARCEYYYFKKETTVCGDIGQPIRSTIDADLQFLTQEAVREVAEKFNSKEGAAIIMDPKNGEILAMVSYPYFDPNSAQTVQLDLVKNRIITDAHELGSVIKIFAALAALEEGVVDNNELIDCQNSKTAYIEGRKINTVAAHGSITFSEVIAASNNIGIAIVAKRLNEKLYEHYTRLGFGAKTEITFPGESKGFVNHPENWSKQSIISLSYGYEISLTILQLACAMCIIANNGYSMRPQLLMDRSDGEVAAVKLYSDESIAAIKEILEKTTLQGTARRAAIKGYRIMSKTGTANMLVNGKYDPKRNLYSCAGIVEKGDYQRVIVTFIKEARYDNIYASTVAVPLFEIIAQHMLIHDGIIS